ncbi:MAG: Y-family DNA polymerase [Planctomycetota bacterium]
MDERNQPSKGPVALVDCNNFYASCERAFDPSLAGVPVCVLSNNDGCVIARSQEVKDLGVKMGTPAFKVREELKAHGVRVFSSNYTLYADMSRRVMEIMERLSPAVEVYSIDEAFIDLSIVPAGELEDFGRDLQATIHRWTGIPVGVGIGSTKTLAKVASHYGKKHRAETNAVFVLDEANADGVLRWCEIGDVWGVGRAHGPRLIEQGIRNAADLRDADERHIRRQMTVVGHRTVLELRGQPCIPLEMIADIRKGVASTRSFGRTVTSPEELREAVAAYVDRASGKLRREGLVAGVMQVFIRTDRFREDQPQYGNTATVRLEVPTADVCELTAIAARMLAGIYKPGFAYKKAGVMLLDLQLEAQRQTGLFDPLDREARSKVLTVYDAINARWGRGTITTAARSLGEEQRRQTKRTWQMKREFLSPAYTTDWTQLPVVRA